MIHMVEISPKDRRNVQKLFMHCLRSCFLFLTVIGTAFFHAQPVQAQESDRQDVSEIANGPVVLELFSSEFCPFCPKADRLAGELSVHSDIIMLACHVPYYGTSDEALSLPACLERQNFYNKTIRNGSNFTPQIILNGRQSVVGHHQEEIEAALDNARAGFVKRIDINALGGQRFELMMPDVSEAQNIKIWLAFIDKDDVRDIKSGPMQGQQMAYRNIVSDLSEGFVWDGRAGRITMNVDLKEKNKGFILLVQEMKSAAILAAGQYTKP